MWNVLPLQHSVRKRTLIDGVTTPNHTLKLFNYDDSVKVYTVLAAVLVAFIISKWTNLINSVGGLCLASILDYCHQLVCKQEGVTGLGYHHLSGKRHCVWGDYLWITTPPGVAILLL